MRDLVDRFPLRAMSFRAPPDGDFVIEHMNAALEVLIGLRHGEAIGKRASDVLGRLCPEAADWLLAEGNAALAAPERPAVRNLCVRGRTYRATLFSVGGTLVCSLENMRLQFDCASIRRRAPKCASSGRRGGRDPLTGLCDRACAYATLNLYVRRHTSPLSIVHGDVDGLKLINDALGYGAGDEILIWVAEVFRANCRAADLVARWGDDEFLLVLPGAPGEEARKILARLRGAIAAQGDVRGCATVSFGYASNDRGFKTAQELIREAEKRTYRRKLLESHSHRNNIIKLMLTTLHEKSAETQEHSDRMAAACRAIAAELKLSDEMVNDLVLLAMLHDIGKIGIRHEILTKPGPLTEEERLEIQKHPEIGHRITQNIPELSQISNYILAHHEWWDGSGYPNGLKGEEIPIASRIISVVDAFDVMVSGRSYRAARSEEDAIAELQRCAGTQFDPQIVDIFVRKVRSLE